MKTAAHGEHAIRHPSHRSVCPCTVSHLPATTLSRTYVKRAVHALSVHRVPLARNHLVSYVC
eukprot:4272573-Prymnesium_polylepis.1